MLLSKETLINCLCGRIAALRGARNLNIFQYMPRFLRSVRLALHPAQAINQHFPNAILLIIIRFVTVKFKITKRIQVPGKNIIYAIAVLISFPVV